MAADLMYVNVLVLASCVVSREINGTFRFVMSWDSSLDVISQEFWTDKDEDSSVFNVVNDNSTDTALFREKRDAEPNDNYARHGAECFKVQEQVASTVRDGRVRLGQAVHTVVMVEELEEIRMTCHYCDSDELAGKAQTEDEKDVLRQQKIWYKLARKKKGKYYKVREVELDMHDDPEENRVFVTDSHTLVIRGSYVKDAGTYFCRDTTRKDEYFKPKMTEEDIHKFIKPESSLQFLYHVDVLLASDISAVLVTTLDMATLVEMDEKRNTSKKMTELPKSSPPKRLPDINIVVTTVWMSWSPCSVCGKIGTRRRMGECTVRKLNESVKAQPWYLDVTLSSYIGGVPCESSLFEEHDKILEAVSRPDEVEEEDCEVSCTNYTIKVADLISGRTQDRVREELFEESEGDDIVFMCPKAPVDMPVAWINESRVLVGPWLKDETGDRVSIDEHNSLHIKPLQPWDAGHYACIYGGRIRGRLRLEVKMKRPPSRVLLYAYYLLLTYPADLLVFLVLLCVRRKERSKVLNFDLLPEFEGSEESDEENDEKSDESEEDEKSDGSEEDESLESDES